MDDPPTASCTVRAWRPDVAGIAEVFHARISGWGYPPHCHDTWTVLIVDDGAIDYRLDRRPCAAHRDTVAVLPPGVVHDGQPSARAGSFHKRCLYLDRSFLPIDLVGPAVDGTTVVDPGLRAAVAGLHASLAAGEDPVDGEARLALIGERFLHHLDSGAGAPAPVERGPAGHLRDLLDADLVAPPTLAEAAALLDRSVPHLVRSFTSTFGVSPHAYLTGRRIEAARALLLEGTPPAAVAPAVGFYDQAHLGRHFKRHTSTTPARYARSAEGAAPGGSARPERPRPGQRRRSGPSGGVVRWGPGDRPGSGAPGRW